MLGIKGVPMSDENAALVPPELMEKVGPEFRGLMGTVA